MEDSIPSYSLYDTFIKGGSALALSRDSRCKAIKEITSIIEKYQIDKFPSEIVYNRAIGKFSMLTTNIERLLTQKKVHESAYIDTLLIELADLVRSILNICMPSVMEYIRILDAFSDLGITFSMEQQIDVPDIYPDDFNNDDDRGEHEPSAAVSEPEFRGKEIEPGA